MTKDEKKFRNWLKENYGIQEYNNYSNTQTEELAIQYAKHLQAEAFNEGYGAGSMRLKAGNPYEKT